MRSVHVSQPFALYVYCLYCINITCTIYGYGFIHTEKGLYTNSMYLEDDVKGKEAHCGHFDHLHVQTDRQTDRQTDTVKNK